MRIEGERDGNGNSCCSFVFSGPLLKSHLNPTILDSVTLRSVNLHAFIDAKHFCFLINCVMVTDCSLTWAMILQQQEAK